MDRDGNIDGSHISITWQLVGGDKEIQPLVLIMPQFDGWVSSGAQI
jgi:hypothetical protein